MKKLVLKTLIPAFLVKEAFTLVSASVLAQLIAILFIPILTRIYSPSTFGVFTLYMAAVNILFVFSSGQYEQAIFLPRSKKAAANIWLLSMICTLVVSALLVLLIGLVTAFDMSFGPEIPGNLLWMIPIHLIAMKTYTSGTYLLLRESQSKYVARLKVGVALFTSGFQLLLAFVTDALGLGLVLGAALAQLVVAFATLWIVHEMNWFKQPDFKLNRIIWATKKYIKYPAFNATFSVLDQGRIAIIPWMLALSFPLDMVGEYGLAERIVVLPTALVGIAVSQLYFRHLAEIHNSHIGMRPFFLGVSSLLFLLSLPWVLLIWTWGPELISWFFGSNWANTGTIVAVLVIKSLFELSVSPLIVSFNVIDKQEINAAWKVFAFATTATFAYVGAQSGDIESFVAWIVAAAAINYTVVFGLLFYFLGRASVKNSGNASGTPRPME